MPIVLATLLLAVAKILEICDSNDEGSHCSKITHAFLRNEKTKITQLNEKRSSIPWRLRMPI